MIGNRSAAMNAVLTQGRSKRIPMIVLSQRPVFMSRFVFTEADYFQVFNLTDDEDQKRVRSFVPKYKRGMELPKYHSIYHDVSEYDTVLLTPVPSRDEILDTFAEKLRRRRQII
jgi:DNA helicase HerA-like ATPase